MELLGILLAGQLTSVALLPERSISAAEREAVGRGAIIAKVVETPDRKEIVAVGVMRVEADAARVLAELRDVEGHLGDPSVLLSRRFADEPSPADLQDLDLDPGDLSSLAACRPADCDVRLPSAAMERFRTEVDWTAPGRSAEASRLWRQLLAGYAADYRTHGRAGLTQYDDNSRTERVADGLDMLLDRFAGLSEIAPELRRYLATFPAGRLPDCEDVLYWTKEKLWRRTVHSLNHVTILDRSSSPSHLVLAVTRQIYANHYFGASLSLMAFVEEPAGGGQLFFVSRTRADVRSEGFNWVERLIMRRLVQGRVRGRFERLRGRLSVGSLSARR